MLIPRDGGKWSWNDGPVCDSKEEALAKANVSVMDGAPPVYVIDVHESMVVETDEDPIAR